MNVCVVCGSSDVGYLEIVPARGPGGPSDARVYCGEHRTPGASPMTAGEITQARDASLWAWMRAVGGPPKGRQPVYLDATGQGRGMPRLFDVDDPDMPPFDPHYFVLAVPYGVRLEACPEEDRPVELMELLGPQLGFPVILGPDHPIYAELRRRVAKVGFAEQADDKWHLTIVHETGRLRVVALSTADAPPEWLAPMSEARDG